MMGRKPPLDVVRVVRARALDDAKAGALATAGAAQGARREAERAAAIEQAGRAREADAHAKELAERPERVSPRELAQLAAFELGAEARIDRLRASTRAASQQADDAGRADDEARALLVRAKGALEGVEGYQARARQAEEREEQARADEGAEEAFAARRPPRRI